MTHSNTGRVSHSQPRHAATTSRSIAAAAFAATFLYMLSAFTTHSNAAVDNPPPATPPQAEPSQAEPAKPASEPQPTPEPAPAPEAKPESPAPSQEPTPAQEPAPAQVPGPVPPHQPVSDIPSLDDILGITDPPSSPPSVQPEAHSEKTTDLTPEQIADRFREQLERDLAGLSLGDQFQQIVTLLDDAATRLDPARTAPVSFTGDPGLTTQRIQQTALDRLDALIEQAQQQQQQQQSSSSSNQRKQQQQQQQMPQQGQQQQQEASGQGENQQESQPPGRQDGQLRPTLEAARAAWGSLPERVRDTLLQGSGDTFSTMYERLTESYYRKVAEESSR